MAALEGFISGMLGRRDQIAEQNFRDQQLAHQRESHIYELLLNSPDPEIQAAAVSGLISGTQKGKPSKNLFGKWFGEQQANPAMGDILKLLNTPVPTTETKQVAGPAGPAAVQGFMGAPPPGGSAAQVPTSPTDASPTPLAQTTDTGQGIVSTGPKTTGAMWSRFATDTARDLATGRLMGSEFDRQRQETGVPEPTYGSAATLPSPTETVNVVGTAPPTDLGPVQIDPRLATAPPTPTSFSQEQTVMKPRRVFLSPEEQITREALAQGRAKTKVEQERAAAIGFTPEEYKQLEMMKARRAAGGGNPYQKVTGTVLDPTTGQRVHVFGNFNAATGKHEAEGYPGATFTPDTKPGGQRGYGKDLESTAQRLYHMSYADLAQSVADGSTPAEALDHVSTEARKSLAETAGDTSTARAQATNEASLDKPAGFAESQAGQVPLGSTPRQSLNQVVPTADSIKTEQALKNVGSQLDNIIPLLAVLPRQNELGGKAPGWALATRRATRRDEVAALESAVRAIAAPLQRASGDTRLSDVDLRQALQRITEIDAGLRNPLGGDTQESALRRIQETKKFLATSEANRTKKVVPNAAAPGVGQPPPAGGGASAAPARLDSTVPGLVIRDGQLVQQ